jgi:hypothetical protein
VYFNARGGTYGLGIADFNGDGKDDVATTTILNVNTTSQAGVLEVFSGAASRSFDPPVIYTIANIPSLYQVVTGDFNGDGKPDLAMLIGTDLSGALIEPTPVAVFENQGDGTFTAPVSYVVGGASGYATAIAASDFNGDGVTDIAVTMDDDESPVWSVSVLLSESE